MSPKFTVKTLACTPNPQQTIYAAMHQDYSQDFVGDQASWGSEEDCGAIIVKRLLAGHRGHYGCLEHPQITLACGYFPHSVMQQARTHRVGITFDVQSFRYTGNQFIEVANGHRDIEDVFYLRPVGLYNDRKGLKYYYSPQLRLRDLEWCHEACSRYQEATEAGMAEEHARGLVPFDYRQHFVVSFNLRSLLHFMDLRHKKDAQLEIQQLCELLWSECKLWCPQVSQWYEDARLSKARLAP